MYRCQAGGGVFAIKLDVVIVKLADGVQSIILQQHVMQDTTCSDDGVNTRWHHKKKRQTQAPESFLINAIGTLDVLPHRLGIVSIF